MSEGQHTEKTDPYTVVPTESFLDAIQQLMRQMLQRGSSIGRLELNSSAYRLVITQRSSKKKKP